MTVWAPYQGGTTDAGGFGSRLDVECRSTETEPIVRLLFLCNAKRYVNIGSAPLLRELVSRVTRPGRRGDARRARCGLDRRERKYFSYAYVIGDR